jgi:threonine/homoserine/homoserine lactone efflux protein
MIELSTLLVFVAASLALLLTPGPAVLFVVARSIEQGKMAGIISTLGISVGTLFHVAAASFGVSAILTTSAQAFNILKFVGAAYLIFLGIRTLLSKDSTEETLPKRRRLSRIFLQGIIVNVTNPKTALFFFAFLPQFVDVARGDVVMQVLFLGTLFTFLGMMSDSVYALIAGSAADWLKSHSGFLKIRRYLSGSIYLLLGIVTALAGNRSE